VPELVERKKLLQGTGKKLQNACFDVEFALGAIQKMHNIEAIAHGALPSLSANTP
jgi:hypothetical protein